MHRRCKELVAALALAMGAWACSSGEAKGAQVRGVVRGAGGAAISVSLTRASPYLRLETRADGSGQFVLREVPPGDWALAPVDVGFAVFPQSRRVTVGQADVEAAAFDVQPRAGCVHGFCLEDSGTTQDLLGVWGRSAGDVWAVGAAGTALHWDGATWAAEATGTTVTLRGTWAGPTGDAWAVGDGGAILRRGAGGWEAVASGTSADLYDVWGTSANDAWAVGAGGLILHWDGAAWSESSSGLALRLHRVRGASASDAWAVGGGTGASMLRWNGTGWAAVMGGSVAELYGLWVGHAGEVWAAGGDQGDTGPFPGTLPQVISGDGASWAFHPGRGSRALWGTAAGPVWAFGGGYPWRALAYFDGASLRGFQADEQGPADYAFGEVRGAWGEGEGIWTVGLGGVIRSR